MKIAARYSHLNGFEFMKVHHPILWDEIEGVVASVDASRFRTKVSNEKTMKGRKLFDPRALNQAFKDEFKSKGWDERRAYFFVTGDAKLIRRTLHLEPAEQKKLIEEAGQTPVRSLNQTDFVKDRIAVEVQFGKYFSVAYDLFVKHLAFYVGDLIDVGIEIVPMRSMSGVGLDEADGTRGRGMSTGVPWYEKELYNLIREGRGVPSVPLVILGIEP